jgi:hypothetical protein
VARWLREGLSRFGAKISNYATNGKNEAFAEAFKDVLINGKKAKAASKLIMSHWKD